MKTTTAVVACAAILGTTAAGIWAAWWVAILVAVLSLLIVAGTTGQRS